MADLGMTRKEMWGSPSCCDSKDYDNEIVHPTLELNGKQAALAGMTGLEFGEEVTVTVRMKVSRLGGISENEKTPSVSFAVMEIDGAAKKKTGLAGRYADALKKGASDDEE